MPILQSLYIIECPEFRQLLLLMRQDLHDSDILRRTKLRELVIKVWNEYLEVVKQDLAVSTQFCSPYW